MEDIFADCEILTLEKDSSSPGVFIKVRKPSNFKEVDLYDYSLYSILLNRRVKEDLQSFKGRRTIFRYRIKDFIRRVGGYLLSKL